MGYLSQAVHRPTKNLTIQIMENKERYHNATSKKGGGMTDLNRLSQDSFAL